MYSDYDVYKIFKEVECGQSNKKSNILSEDGYQKKLSSGTKNKLQHIADTFNTRFSNINLEEYIKCGFFHFKSFDYDKMFRDIVIKEYISRDSRNKRGMVESLSKVMEDLNFIGKSLHSYVLDMNNNQKTIIGDYILNNIGYTVLVYCISKNIFIPNSSEWEYLNTIRNNYPQFESSAIKFFKTIDKWEEKHEKAR